MLKFAYGEPENKDISIINVDTGEPEYQLPWVLREQLPDGNIDVSVDKEGIWKVVDSSGKILFHSETKPKVSIQNSASFLSGLASGSTYLSAQGKHAFIDVTSPATVTGLKHIAGNASISLSSLSIPDGAVLVIDSGVHIILSSLSQLNISGTLILRGGSRFTVDDIAPSSLIMTRMTGSGKMINFSGSAFDDDIFISNRVDISSNSILITGTMCLLNDRVINCDISFAENGQLILGKGVNLTVGGAGILNTDTGDILGERGSTTKITMLSGSTITKDTDNGLKKGTIGAPVEDGGTAPPASYTWNQSTKKWA